MSLVLFCSLKYDIENVEGTDVTYVGSWEKQLVLHFPAAFSVCPQTLFIVVSLTSNFGLGLWGFELFLTILKNYDLLFTIYWV